MKRDGFDALQKTLREAGEAIASLDGEITKVEFDPSDPASIETAIQQMESAIDGKVAGYESNSLVAPLIEQAKEHYRQAILDKASELRASGAK